MYINSSNFKVADDATNKFSAYSQTIDVTTSTSPEKVSDYFKSVNDNKKSILMTSSYNKSLEKGENVTRVSDFNDFLKLVNSQQKKR